jgi:hypothetical protein
MMTKKRFACFVAALLIGSVMLAGQSADAAPIDIFNTGVDANGNVLSPGAADTHYRITASAQGSFVTPAAAVVQSNHPAWLSNDTVGATGSSWISVIATGNSNIAAGSYVFQTTFDLTGLDPSSAAITAQVAVDNTLTDIRLNGLPLAITRSGFAGFQAPLTINSGFVAGVNTLAFLVLNASASPNPGGFRLEILDAQADVIPEPATMAALSIAGLLLLRRR